MNPHVFREYDIRGVADRDFDDRFVRDLGRALGTFHHRAGGARLALGRDCRLSSPRLHAALVEGLLEAGMSVVDIGVGPTPLMYFAVFTADLDGGVMITGSHNPPDENGFKLMVGKGSLFGKDILAVRDLMADQDFDLPGGGTVTSQDFTAAYVDHMHKHFNISRPSIPFAIDAGNGSGGPLAVATMKAVGLSPVALLCEMDGTFPVHHPDPTDPHTLQGLRERVLSDGLELGIAFDGDGDRLGVIDARGEVVWGDRLMIVLSREVLKAHPGAAVIGEVKCSQTLYDDIAAHGGRPVLWKTGHSLIKSKMKQEGALLAGEMSGHLFFADRYFGFDDAIYAALRLVEILAAAHRPLHELLADVPKTFTTPEIRVPCPDDEKFAVVARVVEYFRGKRELVEVDGARVLFDDGWGLVRASNTQPVLVLRFEAQSEPSLAAIRTEIEAALTAARS